jgi:hypothetical protein
MPRRTHPRRRQTATAAHYFDHAAPAHDTDEPHAPSVDHLLSVPSLTGEPLPVPTSPASEPVEDPRFRLIREAPAVPTPRTPPGTPRGRRARPAVATPSAPFDPRVLHDAGLVADISPDLIAYVERITDEVRRLLAEGHSLSWIRAYLSRHRMRLGSPMAYTLADVRRAERAVIRSLTD